MKKSEKLANLSSHQFNLKSDNNPEGYPLYPDNEDVYNKLKKVREIDPEDISNLKVFKKAEKRNEKDFSDLLMDDDLDIPDDELDDEEEIIGIEDDENN
ncbi:hypothetical protein [Flavobacterium sp. UBA6031]|uniref:hypothetical protein n=1 Tax=Flavobacterium sp. UBA6031 TaxID=1946551 RepID=UPI0025C1E3C3|nr:hypothetical protein [Flavobacterium sp. UBA6031]